MNLKAFCDSAEAPSELGQSERLAGCRCDQPTAAFLFLGERRSRKGVVPILLTAAALFLSQTPPWSAIRTV